MRKHPGSNCGSHGATGTHIGAQMHLGPLKVHHAGNTWNGYRVAMLKKQIALGGLGQGATDLDKGSGHAAAPIDNHTSAHEDISNNDTGAEDSRGNTDVTAENATEARVIGIHEIRRHRGIHWVGIVLTPHIKSNIADGKDDLGGRRLPEEAGLAKGAFDLDKRGRECHIKDKVRKAAPRAGALNGPGNIKMAPNNQPSVSACFRQQGAEVPLAEVALDNGGLSHQPEQGRFQLHRCTNGLNNALQIIARCLKPYNELPDDRVQPALKVNKQGHGANAADTGGGKETTHTQGRQGCPFAPEAAALRVKEDCAQKHHEPATHELVVMLLNHRVQLQGAASLH